MTLRKSKLSDSRSNRSTTEGRKIAAPSLVATSFFDQPMFFSTSCLSSCSAPLRSVSAWQQSRSISRIGASATADESEEDMGRFNHKEHKVHKVGAGSKPAPNFALHALHGQQIITYECTTT